MAYVSVQLRAEVTIRANNCCEYCRLNQQDYPFSFHVEHIHAEKHGGETVSSNLCLSCPTCNAYKGSDLTSIDPSSNEIVRLFHPRQDKWLEHFQLHDGLIASQTSIGRVTSNLLQFNKTTRILERTSLASLNRYPCPLTET